MTTFMRMLSVVAAMFLAACYPESRNPIAPYSQTVAAPELEGTWHVRDKKEAVFYHIHTRGEKSGGWVDVIGVNVPKDDGKLESGAYELLPTRIGGVRYFSFREKGPKAARTFGFIRYEFDWHGRLRMWMANDEVFGNAVLAGKLRGKVKKSKLGTDVELTDTSERIAGFVAGQDPKKAFDVDSLVLEKVK